MLLEGVADFDFWDVAIAAEGSLAIVSEGERDAEVIDADERAFRFLIALGDDDGGRLDGDASAAGGGIEPALLEGAGGR